MADTSGVPELKGNSFALPEAVLKAHEQAFARGGMSWQPRMATVGPYRVPVGLFTGPGFLETAELFLKVFELLGSAPFSAMAPRMESCRVGGKKTTLFCGVSGTIRMVPVAKDGKKPEATAYKTYEAVLAQFSCLAGGLNIELYEELDRPTQRAPQADVPGLIRIMTYAAPPGELMEQRIVRVFDWALDNEIRSIRACLPTPGRGVVAGDGTSKLVQLLGNNWYFLLPMIDTFNEVTSKEIFAYLVALAWDNYREPKTERKHRPVAATRKQFCKAALAWDTKAREVMDLIVMSHDAAIESRRQDLARLERDRRKFVMLRDALAASPTSGQEAGFAQQWRRLQHNPALERLELVQDGLQATTKHVVFEHEGKRYPLGQFVIRIGTEGILSVWNLDILHPKGVPHPHIRDNGGPCFGNAADAIEQAAAQHRYADAIEYTLRWLIEGYDPPHAMAKIEEWPAEATAEQLQEAS